MIYVLQRYYGIREQKVINIKVNLGQESLTV